jgi:hypothetical protein
MKLTFSKLLWLFILAIAAYDIGYSWQWRAYMHEIECNPVAAWIIGTGGIWPAIVYRAGWLVFAALLCGTHTRFTKYITPTWAVGHAFLAVQYCRLLLF